MSSPALFLRCAKRGKDSGPHPAQAEPAEVIEDPLPGRQVVRQLSSLTSGLEHVEDGIEDVTQGMSTVLIVLGSSGRRGRRKVYPELERSVT